VPSARDKLVDFLRSELIGPDPVEGFVKDGEEILYPDPPRLRYVAGILFPQRVDVAEVERADKQEQPELEFPGFTPTEIEETRAEDDLGADSSSSGEAPDSSDDVVSMSNAYLPSALGFSCRLEPPRSGLEVSVRAGVYETGDHTLKRDDGGSAVVRAYFRRSIAATLVLEVDQLPRMGQAPLVKRVVQTESGAVLNLHVVNRSSGQASEATPALFTFSLVNASEAPDKRLPNELCFFQVELFLSAVDKSPCFAPFRRAGFATDDDTQSNELLYRDVLTFAIGHGCAAGWSELKDGRPTQIRAEPLPIHEVKPIRPCTLKDLPISMSELSDFHRRDKAIAVLTAVCDRYSAWIKRRVADAQDFKSDHRKTSARHLDHCRECLGRMQAGIRVLQDSDEAWRAFTLMNRAMLLQQLRSKMRLRKWRPVGGRLVLDAGTEPMESDPSTWPDSTLGNWHPFQIAFILLNVPALVDHHDHSRKVVDLLWFPTGGGKTEAYLGLTAFVVFLRRLRNANDVGTSVIMRYTLRLLTAQQFQRAAALVTACEAIRREVFKVSGELGESPITLGLWVGRELTPNNRAVALQKLHRMQQQRVYDNPFVLLRCPWCGAEFGQVQSGHSISVRGYHNRPQPAPARVVFKCDNPSCTFSERREPLPLLVVDEDIYENPPSVVIGTVDKFAMMPWRPEARSLFGFREDGIRVSPPQLIIQDELHLISGPLGSLAGLYETAVAKLCEDQGFCPKIVASTATISRAKAQCRALYARPEDAVSVFPPPGLNYSDSFFSYEDDAAPGRLYAGVFPTSGISGVATHARIMAAILQGSLLSIELDTERDPYWTVIDYFNSLRELGHAATLVRAEIAERIKTLCLRKGLYRRGPGQRWRVIREQIELTSRVPSGRIAASLADLETAYPATDERQPVDVCLATSMLSVGVDVPRLGLMVMTGQPKLTSEYIQVTSRVGRSDRGPGLVVVQYNPARPRDRSHFERFHSYHARLYAQVEPTSVTPFSAPARERALHAVRVTLLRMICNRLRLHPGPPSQEEFGLVREALRERVELADPSEMEATLQRLIALEGWWQRSSPSKYGDFGPPTDEVPLMHRADQVPPPGWGGRSWPTHTSMRGVEPTCEGKDIHSYPGMDEPET